MKSPSPIHSSKVENKTKINKQAITKNKQPTTVFNLFSQVLPQLLNHWAAKRTFITEHSNTIIHISMYGIV